MNETKINEIMDNIFKDENLCIVREALNFYFENKDKTKEEKAEDNLIKMAKGDLKK